MTRGGNSKMNVDQALIRRFQTDKTVHAAIESSALAEALVGRIVDLDQDAGRITLSYQPSSFFIQAEQVIQGGAIAAMVDFAMAFAALAVLPDGQSVATVNLNVAYLRAAKAGYFQATGEIERRGRSLVFTRAGLAQADGTLVATATSTLSVIPERGSTNGQNS